MRTVQRTAAACFVCLFGAYEQSARSSPQDEDTLDDYSDESAPYQDQIPIEAQPDTYADTDPSALTDFYNMLAPYGTWVNDPTYGTVWFPDPGEVGQDFTPYATGGHWEYDNNDYVWVSD